MSPLRAFSTAGSTGNRFEVVMTYSVITTGANPMMRHQQPIAGCR